MFKKKATNSEWIDVRESGIHGSGVFAAKDIPKGIRILEYVGEKITKKESDKRAADVLEAAKHDPGNGGVYIFELDKEYDLDGNVPWNTARLINHTCEPNCETEDIDGRIWIISMREIKKGEELSYDYCYDVENFDDHVCMCGSNGCVGYIVRKRSWWALKKRLAERN